MGITERSPINFPQRAKYAFAVVCVLLSVLLVRLWYLQVLRGEYFRIRSEQNRLREVYVPPTRGMVTDRHGTVLARNRPSFNVELVLEDSPDPEETVRYLATLLSQDPELLLERSKQPGRRRRFEPRVLMKDVSREVVARVMAHKYALPGVVINVVPAREYVHGDVAAHVLGYIREITKEQLSSATYAGYLPGDMVGQYGVEARWEHHLQGRRGVQLLIVNATGNRIGEYSFEPDIAGHNVTLTLDFETQRAADEALEGVRGAVVAMDPKTGEILAMSSSPRFDPNMFAGEIDPAVWRDLVSGPGRKLQNRAVQGVYPPGSVFKVFMAAAILAEGIARPGDGVNCPGFLPFGGRNFRCHKRDGHGMEDLRDALVHSCDVYFYVMGSRLGVDRIHEYATKFGLGTKTGLNLVDEPKGLIPSTAWKRTAFRDPANQKWFPGETLSVVIGQGAVTTTPLQLTRAIAALVNGGKVMRPHLVRRLASPDGQFKDEDFPPEQVGTVDIDPKILRRVADYMVDVVHAEGGTGRRARIPALPDLRIGGKTGTAQVVALEAAGRHDHLNHHAWFSAFAPADDPQIALTVLVENGGGGGSVAAPIARKVLEAFFRVPQDAESASAAAPTR